MSRLRRRCERRLVNIAIPNPFDLRVFCTVVADHRGRPLNLQPMPGVGSGAPCGLWISVAAADYVFYDPETSRLHAEHIVLHELAHMLSGHSTAITGGTTADGDTVHRLVPDLDPKTIDTMLSRAGYTTAQEREAEMLASLIRARSTDAPDRRPDDTLGRVAAALKFPS